MSIIEDLNEPLPRRREKVPCPSCKAEPTLYRDRGLVFATYNHRPGCEVNTIADTGEKNCCECGRCGATFEINDLTHVPGMPAILSTECPICWDEIEARNGGAKVSKLS